MHLRAPAPPAWQLAQLCAEAALCLMLGAASFGRADDRALLGASAGLLALCGAAVIALAALGALVDACRSRRPGTRLPAPPTARPD